jgi:hexosaminidase
MLELEVPWIITGPGIRKDILLDAPNDNTNTAPTIARILGLKIPDEWIGKPVAEAFTTKTIKQKTNHYVAKPWCSLPEGAFPGPQQIELSTTKPGAAIYYSLDGSMPNVSSSKYSSPFTINQNCTFKAVAISGTNISQPIMRIYTFVQDVKTATLTSPPGSKYPGLGVSGLFDGLIGSSNPANKQWMGFEGENFEVTFDLGEVKVVKALGIDVLQMPSSGILLPARVEFYVSDDGKNFRLQNTLYPSEMDDPQPDGTVMLSRNFDNLRGQYFRIKAISPGTIPPGQPDEGQKAWLLVSEVDLE